MGHQRPNVRIGSALLAAALLFVMVFAATGTSAATSSFCGFTDVTSLQLNDSAVQSGTRLRLTSNGAQSQVGTAFLKMPVAFPYGTSFHTYFRALIGPKPGGVEGVSSCSFFGADGFSFILQNQGATVVGGNASSIGYGGVTPSVEVEFDAFQNSFDPDANHIGVMQNGDASNHKAVGTPPFSLTDSGGFSAWIDFDGITHQLSVFASTTTVKPNVPVVTCVIDIGSILGGTAYVGFTSSTGLCTNTHEILGWEFSTDGIPCQCKSDECGASTPACSTSKSICVQCSDTIACADPTQVCDVASGTCVGTCFSNTDCGGTTPLCELGKCVQCSASNMTACTGQTPVCDVASGTCVGECLSNTDCGGTTPVCEQAKCVQCSATDISACAGQTPVCDVASGTCVECLSDMDCGANAPSCDPVTETCHPRYDTEGPLDAVSCACVNGRAPAGGGALLFGAIAALAALGRRRTRGRGALHGMGGRA